MGIVVSLWTLLIITRDIIGDSFYLFEPMHSRLGGMNSLVSNSSINHYIIVKLSVRVYNLSK